MTDINNEYEDYTPNILTLTDENNETHQFDVIDEVEHNEERYIAAVPYYEDEEQALKEEPVLLIFKIGEPDEEGLETYDIVDDDEEYYEVAGIFQTRLEEMFEIEE